MGITIGVLRRNHEPKLKISVTMPAAIVSPPFLSMTLPSSFESLKVSKGMARPFMRISTIAVVFLDKCLGDFLIISPVPLSIVATNLKIVAGSLWLWWCTIIYQVTQKMAVGNLAHSMA